MSLAVDTTKRNKKYIIVYSAVSILFLFLFGANIYCRFFY